MTNDIGKLILRLTIGGLLLFHGIHKLKYGIKMIKGLLIGQGMPEILAYGVYIGEVIAPILLILGVYSRIWAGVIAFNMMAAIWLTHFKGMTVLGSHGAWGMESIAFYLFGALTILFLGSGTYALKKD